MRVVYKFSVVMAIVAIGVFGIILSEQQWHDYDMYLASYSVAWFGTVGALTVMISQEYRKDRKVAQVRHTLSSFGGVVVMAAVLAVLFSAEVSLRTGLVFVAIAVSTIVWMIILKVDVMLINAYDRGRAEVLQAVSGQAT